MKQFWKTTRTRKKKDGDDVEDGLDVDGEDGLRWVNKEAKKVYVRLLNLINFIV